MSEEDTDRFEKRKPAMDKLIERMVLGGCAILLSWTAIRVVDLGEVVASYKTTVDSSQRRLESIEGVVGEMKSLNTTLMQLREDQRDMKKTLEDMRSKR